MASEESSELSNYTVQILANGTEILICWNKPNAELLNSQDALATSLPLLFRQIVIITIVSSAIFLILKPFHQPRFVANLMAGILLGPSCLGQAPAYVNAFFPYTSATILESFTYLGSVYYIFLVGLEMNLTPILQVPKKSVAVAAIGIVLPFAIGFGLFYLIVPEGNPSKLSMAGPKSAFVWGVALTGTNLSELTRILADLKLLRTDIGRTALSSAFISEIGTWLFLVILIIIGHPKVYILAISAVGFVLISAFAVRPALSWLIRQTSDGEEDYKESHVRFVLCGVLLFGFITDALGLTSLFGAFIFGFILPGGYLATAIRDKLEKVTSWILIPLYCMLLGLKTNVSTMMPDGTTRSRIAIFMLFSWLAKFLPAFVMSLRYGMKLREASALGVLMNTKGLLAVIVINAGRDLNLLNIQTSSIMISTVVAMTFTVPLIIKHVYKPRRRLMVHKYRTIQSTGIDSPLRILVCIHSTRNIRGTIYLLQLSHGTRQYPIRIFAVHLVELTERTSATMLVVQNAYRASSSIGPSRAFAKAESEQIIEAFEDYQRQSNNCVSYEALTALSPYTTMHVDICSIAEDKRANMIIIPFHIQGAKEERADDMSSSVRSVNQNVLVYAPCSVGLLVNRGLGMSNQGVSCIILFFIGGPDDREALSYAGRMSTLPEVHLTVVRFIAGERAQPEMKPTISDILNNDCGSSPLVPPMHEREKDLDEEYITEFKFRTVNNNSISYSEEAVNNGEETLKCIRHILEQESYEMCIVGQGDGQTSPLLSGLLSLVEFQELGPLGDAIATSNFASNLSVLVIQQYSNMANRSQKGGQRLDDILG